ncbi:hypothetical protein HMPREF0220_1433 [Clostridioides difficile NAP08]|uniref:Uncharacterized protein n=1 Tax=Clostridioides difficile NAP08 TaxID=525259 RepID=D5Q3F1_CLODI|nr:hypothetical protein HMPREF0220_1433 [Clostridioides difficile NAP08]EFH15444.1 hypothetical protein HMPREF0219_1962 [Clostridioides difficile NAP07]
MIVILKQELIVLIFTKKQGSYKLPCFYITNIFLKNYLFF